MDKENELVIGYTTGVFDLFHIGHLNFLENVKKFCDKLIVGITTDELSTKFKGKKPVIPFEERCEIVAAIKYVDEVVPQTDMDKFEAWKKYKFNVMFASLNPTKKWPKIESEFIKKFSDRKIKPPKIVNLPYTPRISSTSRRNMLKKTLQ